jgi:predicted HicB family RNase H-like nuclease
MYSKADRRQMKVTEHRMTIRIPKELHKAAKIKSAESEVGLSEAVRKLLTLWIEGTIELPKGEKPPKSD